MNAVDDQMEIRELDQRNDDGLEVTLLWSPRTGKVFLAVEDARTEERFHFAVDPATALEAFRHPFAYSRRSSRPATPQTGTGAVPAERG
jgi:hypothetical protein